MRTQVELVHLATLGTLSSHVEARGAGGQPEGGTTGLSLPAYAPELQHGSGAAGSLWPLLQHTRRRAKLEHTGVMRCGPADVSAI